MPITGPRTTGTALTLCLMLLVAATARAEIYRWTDAQGNTVYSDQKTSEDAASAEPDSDKVNYYSPPVKKSASPPAGEPETLATLEAVETPAETHEGEAKGDTDDALTEAECQEEYGRSCDEVVNWKEKALEDCGDDPRCDDPEYLERKYRPRTRDELLAIARRAAIRNGNAEDDIARFLRRKYSNYCDNQAEAYCQQQRSRQCRQQMRQQCEDPRGLEEVLARYDNLSPAEKQRVIKKAKEMALASGKDSLDWDQMAASLIEILVSQAMMGL